jgi:hypothetical protein
VYRRGCVQDEEGRGPRRICGATLSAGPCSWSRPTFSLTTGGRPPSRCRRHRQPWPRASSCRSCRPSARARPTTRPRSHPRRRCRCRPKHRCQSPTRRRSTLRSRRRRRPSRRQTRSPTLTRRIQSPAGKGKLGVSARCRCGAGGLRERTSSPPPRKFQPPSAKNW